jgi:hypothetical protein
MSHLVNDAATLAHRRKVLKEFGLCVDGLEDATPPEISMEAEAGSRAIPEARNAADLKHRPAPIYTPANYTRRRQHVPPMSDAEYGLICDLFRDTAQARVPMRAVLDQLRQLVFTGCRWRDLEDHAAVRLRLRKFSVEMLLAIDERTTTFPEEHAMFAADLRVVCLWCRRYLARLNSREPRSGTAVARLLPDLP